MARFKQLTEWLAWQESCHPQAIDLGLERVREVASRMKLLSPSCKIITVAGTNGKGSCAKALEALLLSAGARVGCYTSPHLLKYNERIKIQGVAVSDEALCRAFAEVDEARGATTLTYFEFGTLAALFLFAEAGLDYWVLEVGLGGRLDATNILDADIAVVTPIALDHTEWLGPDRESIGREKAGISRPAAPLVCADPVPPISVSRIAEQQACPFYVAQRHFGYEENSEHTRFWVGSDFSVESTTKLPAPSIAAALKVLDLLSLLPGGARAGAVTMAQLQAVLDSLALAGRCQVLQLSSGHTIILDVAHNAAAMQYLRDRLTRLYPGQHFKLILAMMADKNIQESVSQLAPIVSKWFLATIPGLQRAATTEFLAEAVAADAEVRLAESVGAALDSALLDNADAPILVTGSFYTVAAALTRLAGEEGAELDNG